MNMKIIRKLFQIAFQTAIGGVAISAGSSAFAGTLELSIENVTEAKGTLFIGVYRVAPEDTASKEGTAWMKKSIGGRKVEVKEAGTVVTKFNELPDGEYAISMYWDQNGNGQMDKNMVGIPTEPYAFSNNAKGTFGPPTWDKAMFKIAGDSKTSIKFD
jgi:uncharacterized protein (DUF2141 family)